MSGWARPRFCISGPQRQIDRSKPGEMRFSDEFVTVHVEHTTFGTDAAGARFSYEGEGPLKARYDMSFRAPAEALLRLFERVRGAGSTTHLLRHWKRGIVVAASAAHAKQLGQAATSLDRDDEPPSTVEFRHADCTDLVGVAPVPVVVDNHTIQTLLSDGLRLLNDKSRRIETLEAQQSVLERMATAQIRERELLLVEVRKLQDRLVARPTSVDACDEALKASLHSVIGDYAQLGRGGAGQMARTAVAEARAIYGACIAIQDAELAQLRLDVERLTATVAQHARAAATKDEL